jgi:thymidylate synthase ThyX
MTDKHELQRWADSAMFNAEPIEDSAAGPKVYLLEATADPLGSIAAAAELYVGNVCRSKADVTHVQRETILDEMQRTKIKAPLEFVQFHFLFEGVTRGFTHQLVRQRTATYVQESTRFAVKQDVPVGVPPSLGGSTGEYMKIRWDIVNKYGELTRYGEDRTTFHPSWIEWEQRTAGLSDLEKRRYRWDLAVERIADDYLRFIDAGMPAEDARGLLPTNLLTRVHYSTDLRALLDHAGNRLCTQAQFEWRLVFARMAEAIRNYNPHQNLINLAKNKVSGESTADMEWLSGGDYWQWEAIAGLLQPVCYQIGKCAFEASFDRKCSIRNRVQANDEISRSSSTWGDDFDDVKGNPIVSGVGPKSVVRDESNRPVFIGSIQPAEWLLDPGAAR